MKTAALARQAASADPNAAAARELGQETDSILPVEVREDLQGHFRADLVFVEGTNPNVAQPRLEASRSWC